MIEFYYHYDKDTHKAKIVLSIDGNKIEHFVDKVICAVHTTTERQETPPKFVVKGRCEFFAMNEPEEKQTAIYLSN